MEGARLKDSFLELFEFGRQLAVRTDFQSLFQLAVEGACHLGRAEAAAIWSLSGEKPRLTIRAWHSALPMGPPPRQGKSLLSRVLREGKPIFFSGPQLSRSDLGKHVGRGPAALFPLRRDDKVWGVMAVAGGERKTFSEEELEWLGLVAGQVELGLRAAEMDGSQQRLREQISEVMSNLGSALSFSQSPSDFLRLVCELSLKLSLADRSFVWLVREGQPVLLSSAARSRTKPLAISRSSTLSLARRVLREESCCGWKEPGSWPAGSALAIPLKGKDEPVGAIALYWAQPEAYTEAERGVLLSFAAQVEMALENLLLQQAGEKSVTQLADLSGAADRMASCPDFSSLMKTTVRATSTALHSPVVGVALLDENGHLALAPHGHLGIAQARTRAFHFIPSRGGLVQRVLEKRQTLAFSTGDAKAAERLPELLGVKSIACAPLLGSEGPLGILFIAHPRCRDFHAAELTLLSTYASQAALALRNTILCDDFTRHLDRLAAFSEYARTLASSLDLKQTLKTVLTSASSLLESDVSFILLKEAGAAGLRLRAHQGQISKTLRTALDGLDQREGLVGLALEQDKVIVSKDLSRDGRCKHRELARQEGLVSSLVAPLKASGNPLGVLCLATRKSRNFTEQDRRLVSMLADAAGIAIENARLYEEEKKRSSSLSTLIHEANHRIRNSLQTVAGLLEMEAADKEHSPEEALRKSIDRIHCIGAVHGLLSRKDLQQVEMKEVARRITAVAAQSARRGGEISLVFSGARVMLESQRATALSLALHELVDNALRHGLASRQQGKIIISFTQSDREIMVMVGDDGLGLPEDFDLKEHSRVGLRIVSGLVNQDLGGEFRLCSKNGGATAQIRFPRQPRAAKPLTQEALCLGRQD